jgi:hypothetical protein
MLAKKWQKCPGPRNRYQCTKNRHSYLIVDINSLFISKNNQNQFQGIDEQKQPTVTPKNPIENSIAPRKAGKSLMKIF